jgi:hypothetical protein
MDGNQLLDGQALPLFCASQLLIFDLDQPRINFHPRRRVQRAARHYCQQQVSLQPTAAFAIVPLDEQYNNPW